MQAHNQLLSFSRREEKLMRIAAVETEEARKQRISRSQAHKDYRKERRERRIHTPEEIETINIFRELGVDFLSTPEAYKLVPERCEGRIAAFFSEKALRFLQENFDVDINE